MKSYYAGRSGFDNEVDIFRFTTKAARDKWVAEHESDGVDERYREHCRRSRSAAGITGALVAVGIFEYHFFVEDIISVDLLAVAVAMAVAMAVAKLSVMLWYRFAQWTKAKILEMIGEQNEHQENIHREGSQSERCSGFTAD